LSAQGIRLPTEIADFFAEQGLPRVFYGSISLQQVTISLIFTFLTAIIAALLPALQAGELEPAEAMRFRA
jgi:ABC-type lipoprotein release transport system permease subunit